MKKTLVCLFLNCWVLLSNGQISTTRYQADSLLKLVLNQTPSITSVNISLKLANFYFFKERRSKVDLDSAELFIKRANTLSVILKSPWGMSKSLLAEAHLNNEVGKQDAAKLLLGKALSLLNGRKDSVATGKIMYELSRCYGIDDSNSLNKKTTLVETAVSLLKNSSDKEEYAADLQMLADLYLNQFKLAKSLNVLRSCLAVYQSIHHRKLQGVYILYSKVYNMLADNNNSLYYGLLAIKFSEEAHEDGAQLCEIENAVGNSYYGLNQYSEATPHFLKGLEIAKRIKDTASIYTLTINTSTNFVKDKKIQQALLLLHRNAVKYGFEKNNDYRDQLYGTYLFIYNKIKDYTRSKVYFEKIEIALKNDQLNDMDRLQLSGFSADYLRAQNRNKEALVLNCEYIRLAEKLHMNTSRGAGYKTRYKLDSAMRNYKSAFLYILRYNKVADSIFNERQDKQIQQLESAYRSKEKDDSINLLHQKAILQEAELSKSRRTTDETIAGICFLLICGGVFGRQYTLRQRAFQIIGKQHAIIVTKNEEILIKNKDLEGLIKEKEFLLIEVHHRVKNNLHTVMSFLSLQSKYLKGEALDAIKISRQRIYAMSLIHQKLYMAEDIKTIDMKSYLEEFVSYFLDSFSPDLQIKFLTNIESIRLSVNKAIPVGLIINEAITNSAKYAFPNKTEAQITLNLRQKEEQIELIIKDNGIGIPGDVNQATYNSLGIKLIKGLCNDLDGILSFDSVTGTTITILFKP